jgi:putative transcriptional regulator
MLLQGKLIQATPLLNDSFFENAMVLIVQHDTTGAIGFVTNKPFGKNLNDLVEFSSSQPFALYDGGPVERENLFFIHQHPNLIEGGQPITAQLFYGGNFKQLVQAINHRTIKPPTAQLFIGYCGWDAGELEAEVKEGSWVVV